MATIPPVPDKFEFATGRPLSAHTAGLGGWLRFNGAILLLAGIAVLIGGGLLALHLTRGPQANTLIPGLVIAALAVPLVGWAVARSSGLVAEVRLYPDGVVWFEKGRWRGARWEEIDEFYRTEVIVNGSVQTREVFIRTAGGHSGRFTHALPRWAKMAEVLQMQTTMAQGPAAQARFRAGEAVAFGEVRVSPRGIKIDGQSLDWQDVDRIEVGNGALLVYGVGKRKGPHAASLGSLPNYLVLLKLLEDTPGPKPTLLR